MESRIKWGVSFGSHDAALAVIRDNRLVFASHSERFSKVKDDPDLHPSLVNHAIQLYGEPHEVVFHEDPWKKKLRYIKSGQWSNVLEPSPKTILRDLGVKARISYVDHHRSHAAAGYHTSGFDHAAVVVIDAIGELATLTVWAADGDDLIKIYQQDYPNSVGLFYSAMTQAAGFKPNGEEYIFMGLAAHGDPKPFAGWLWDNMVSLHRRVPIVRFKHNLHKGCKHLIPSGFKPEDIAAGTQMVYEGILHHILDEVQEMLPSRNLVLMGGCALNCVGNSTIRTWTNWDEVWIMPNPGDAGSALGAVLTEVGHIRWPGPYLGYEIQGRYPVERTMEAIRDIGLAAVANGRAEYGPRALGNRSIFADPRIPDIKKRMNWLKKREQFRPFAAVIPEELADQYFDMWFTTKSPYMQYVFKCKQPDLYPGISHVDHTSRIQTVSRMDHPGLHDLLTGWYQTTGCPMLINTSLNIKGQPLVNDLCDARLFSDKYGVQVFS